jgi:PTS system nitrogen regulatory IIA component
MKFSELITPDRVLCCPQLTSKKRLLESISELLARNVPQHSRNEIFDSLISREKLGSTGLGKGVAIPHARMSALEQPVCAFIKLDHPVEFDASDGQPVDLLCALIVPEHSTDDHLQILSSIAMLFGDQAFCSRIRDCTNETCLYQLLSQGNVQQKSA